MMGCKTYEERCFLAENSLVLNLAQVEKLERTVARLQSENDVQRRMVAAANMTWTSTVPTHTGHYWYADHSHPAPIMVFVALYGFEDMVHYMSGVKVSLKSHHGQWCAVPEPTMLTLNELTTMCQDPSVPLEHKIAVLQREALNEPQPLSRKAPTMNREEV